ncbi:hypothetical protein P7K49_007139 [Saguinus oedipus]|uniref:Uncharacterized protein n=1 Tax=Saguinus oedipus TaxID=9490 RepID=A0ABQ9VU04_SAGOE|nr:hypothetical protein P7K49_007139 [Saguinus oedipus]
MDTSEVVPVREHHLRSRFVMEELYLQCQNWQHSLAILRSGGAQVLEGCIAEIHNITSLDISDNGLESDLSTLIVWLSKNRSIQHLALGKNFNNMKSKNLTPVLDNLVQMIQDEESSLFFEQPMEYLLHPVLYIVQLKNLEAGGFQCHLQLQTVVFRLLHPVS